MIERVGFIGARPMGTPMIGQLASAGHEVVAWNRCAERLQGLPVGDVLTGPEGVLEASVGLIVDHSTIAAGATRALANDAVERVSHSWTCPFQAAARGG